MKVSFHFVKSKEQSTTVCAVSLWPSFRRLLLCSFLLLLEKFEDLGTFWQTDRKDEILLDGNFNLENFLCIEFY